MITAMRHGLGGRPNVFPLPATLLEILFHATGRENIYERLSRSLVAVLLALMNLGWTPPLAAAVARLSKFDTGVYPDEWYWREGVSLPDVTLR